LTLPRYRSGFGQRKAQQRVEEGLYPAWEELLGLHRLDFWHPTVTQRSQPGWPDYTVFGLGWLAFVELKARRVDGRRGKVSVAQERYRASVEAAGGEWRTFLLPDEWDAVDAWLNGHTGKGIWGHPGRAVAS
jgi:hypothetical protein